MTIKPSRKEVNMPAQGTAILSRSFQKKFMAGFESVFGKQDTIRTFKDLLLCLLKKDKAMQYIEDMKRAGQIDINKKEEVTLCQC